MSGSCFRQKIVKNDISNMSFHAFFILLFYTTKPYFMRSLAMLS